MITQSEIQILKERNLIVVRCIGTLTKIKRKLDTNFLKGCGKKSSENHSIKVMTLLKYFPSRMCELWSIFLWIQVLPRAVACLLTKHVRYQISDSAQLKFIYSEKATKFCEISTFLLTVCTVVKSTDKRTDVWSRPSCIYSNF